MGMENSRSERRRHHCDVSSELQKNAFYLLSPVASHHAHGRPPTFQCSAGRQADRHCFSMRLHSPLSIPTTSHSTWTFFSRVKRHWFRGPYSSREIPSQVEFLAVGSLN